MGGSSPSLLAPGAALAEAGPGEQPGMQEEGPGSLLCVSVCLSIPVPMCQSACMYMCAQGHICISICAWAAGFMIGRCLFYKWQMMQLARFAFMHGAHTEIFVWKRPGSELRAGSSKADGPGDGPEEGLESILSGSPFKDT